MASTPPHYNFLRSDNEGMENFLMAQTTYVKAVKTIAEVDTAVMCAINHIILTQLGMKKGIKTFGEAGVRSIY